MRNTRRVLGTSFAKNRSVLAGGSSWASPFPCPPAGQTQLVFCRNRSLSPPTYTPLSSVQAFPNHVGTMPSADFCPALERLTTFPVTQDNRGRSPEVSSTAFGAQPPDLPPVRLMDMGASFRPRLATTPLRFAITSPPSGCEEDFHLQAVDHARHTTKKPEPEGPGCPVGCVPG
jgi:hypothetical protein